MKAVDLNLEEELEIIRAAQHDLRHFEPLYHRYFDAIFRYIFRKTDDEEATSDLTSRVFLNAMNSIHRYEYKGFGFGSWLYKIATNEVYRYYRDQKRGLLSLESDKVNQLMTCAELEDDEEKLNLLGKLVDKLKETEIRILELKYFENKSFEEIAFILDLKESTVKMRLYRALNKLKVKYEAYYKSAES